MSKSKRYFYNEGDISEKRIFSQRDMHRSYLVNVDKAEYTTFKIWLLDMLRSRTFVTI